LRAALAGGIELLKLSHEELIEAGYAASDALHDLAEGPVHCTRPALDTW